MKLYANIYSYNAGRCVAVVRQLGLDVEIVPVDLGKGEQHAPEFVAMNPNKKVPVLVDGDFVLWESTAILQYLADQRPGTLLPTDAKGRANVTRWQAWTLARFNRASDVFLFENMIKAFFGIGPADQAKLDAARPDVLACYDVLEAELAKHDHVAGAALSIADFMLYPTFQAAGHTGLPGLEKHPHLAAWCARMAAQPGFAQGA